MGKERTLLQGPFLYRIIECLPDAKLNYLSFTYVKLKRIIKVLNFFKKEERKYV